MSEEPDEFRLEFFIEPFSEGEPGRHVVAGIEALRQLGTDVEVGAFSSSFTSDAATVAEGARRLVEAALGAGATRVSVQVTTPRSDAAMWVGGLQDALARMITQVEEEMGASLPELDRHSKQRAVRILDEKGAFLLRKAIEDIADAMGVSRITIYNYLSAIRGG